IIGGMRDVTLILDQVQQGDLHAAELLLPLVYEELRKLAAQKMAQEQSGQTLQATALVHEAYLRLVGHAPDQRWEHRGHFFAAAAVMRRILIENARRKQSVKHGAGKRRLNPEALNSVAGAPADELLALDEALAKLAAEDSKKADLVKLRYFAGLTEEDAARAL